MSQLTNALRNTRVRNLWLSSHGHPILVGGDYADPQPPCPARMNPPGLSAIWLNDLGPTLGNGLEETTYPDGVPHEYFAIRHAYRFVFLDGCSTAAYAKQWRMAFGMPLGTPPDNLVGYKLRPSSFLGWDTEITTGTSRYGGISPAAAYFRKSFKERWTDNNQDLKTALEEAFNDADGMDHGNLWGTRHSFHLALYGFSRLHFHQANQADPLEPRPPD